MKRRTVLQLLAAANALPLASLAAAMTKPTADKLAYASLNDVSNLLKTRSMTSVELLQHTLRRIDSIDRHGPTIKAVLELNPLAQTLAKAADERFADHEQHSAIDGVCVLIKGNIATSGPMRTDAGSLALADAPARDDAFIVKKLYASGAVLVGKTNLSEWANIRSTRSTSAWSAMGGLTRNPHVLDRSASGSSSGSAAAVAAGLVALAIGTETDGSIVSPASVCGIVGIKPTLGLVSRSGIIPISSSQDTAGPMARSVSDAAHLLAVIAGRDADDPATRDAPTLDLFAYLNTSALQGKRLGLVRASFGSQPDVLAAMDVARKTLKAQGAILVDDVTLPSTDDYADAELKVLLSELKVDLASYLERYAAPGQPRNLTEVMEFNLLHAHEELRDFGQELFEQADQTKGLNDPAYLEALATCKRLARTEGIEKALADHNLDALIAPTGDPAWCVDPVNGDRSGRSFSTAAAVAGLPHITVPMTVVRGLPVGISFVGAAFSEPQLIGMAYAYEQASNKRINPTFLPTVPMLV